MINSNETVIELQKIITKLESIPINPDKWDASVKSRIYYEVRESIRELIKLKNQLDQIES